MSCTTKPHAQVAIAFATALVDGNYVGAQALLAPELRHRLTPEDLRGQLYGMFRGYADGEPSSVHFDPQFAQEEWPAKLAGDIGWVYVGIHGEGFVEAVTVIVTSTEAGPLIRNIEWGRP